MGAIPRWARRSFPELASFASDEERHRAWKRALRALLRSWTYWAVLLVGTPAVVASIVLYARFAMPWISSMGLVSAPLVSGVVGGVVGGSASVWSVALFRRRIARSLREQLLDAGVPVCLACGYDLRGQVEPRCPECGRAFDPAILTKPPTSAAGDAPV